MGKKLDRPCKTALRIDHVLDLAAPLWFKVDIGSGDRLLLFFTFLDG